MSMKKKAPACGRVSLALCGALFTAIAVSANPGSASTAGAAITSAGNAVPDATLQDTVNRKMSLRKSRLLRLDTDPTPGVAKHTAIEIDGQLMMIDLEPHSVRSARFKAYVSDADGNLTEVEPVPERTYRGVIRGAEGSLVAAGVDEDGLHARVIMADRTEYWVEPVAPQLRELGDTVEGLTGLHVVYQAEDIVRDAHDDLCGNVDNFAINATKIDIGGGPETAQSSGGEDSICEIAFDVDFFYLDRWGMTGATNRITFIVNSGLNIQYPRHVDVVYEVTTFLYRESQVYTAGTIDGLLNEFRSRWLANHGDIVRDVAELFTGRQLSGSVIGIAFFAGICNSNGFNVVEDLSSFSCRADLSAHELGHNWNCVHCSCPGFTMNPSLTCARVFSTASINQIVNFRNSRNCLSSPPPANDDCAGAQPVGDGIVPFDTSSATTDGPALPGSCDEGSGLDFVQDVWFDYTAPCTGEVTANTCISGTYDTRIAVYAGTNCTGALLACNDDACGPGGLQSETTFQAVQGERYRVRVGGVSSGGTGILSMACVKGADCPEDLDMNGAVDFGDILAILAAWGNAGGPEDLDDSGTVDFGDLLIVLGGVGAVSVSLAGSVRL